MTRSVGSYASQGFPDVDIARMLDIPLHEVWKQLAALPAEEFPKAVRARLYTAKIDEPRERFMHGDLGMSKHSGWVEKYYCASCDGFFEDESHFHRHTRERNISRFEFDLEVLAFEAGEGPVIRCGRSEDNVVERTMIAESHASYAEFLKSVKRG